MADAPEKDARPSTHPAKNTKKVSFSGKAVTSQDFIKFWGNFFAFVLSALIEISQEFKTF
jgi:hypothetical protein